MVIQSEARGQTYWFPREPTNLGSVSGFGLDIFKNTREVFLLSLGQLLLHDHLHHKVELLCGLHIGLAHSSQISRLRQLITRSVEMRHSFLEDGSRDRPSFQSPSLLYRLRVIWGSGKMYMSCKVDLALGLFRGGVI